MASLMHAACGVDYVSIDGRIVAIVVRCPNGWMHAESGRVFASREDVVSFFQGG